jgi:CYTH domain-containing protein
MQIKEVGQTFEVADLFGQMAKFVVPEVECAQIFETAELRGYFSEAIVSEYQYTGVEVFPDLLGNSAKILSP